MAGDQPSSDLRSWMESRFDRIDDKLERETTSLAGEIVNTRHGIRSSVDTMALQLTETTALAGQTSARVDEINRWRNDGGPLDQRLHRHSTRMDDADAWRHTLKGALIIASLFVPIVTGVVTAITVAVILHFVG